MKAFKLTLHTGLILLSIAFLSERSHGQDTFTYAGSISQPLETYFEGGSDGTSGSVFTANTSLWITALGIWDGRGSLVNAHDVGLWTAGGSLLASVTVPSGTGAPYVNGYRWVNLSAPVPLTAGNTYVLGAAFPYDGSAQGDFLQGSSNVYGVIPIDPNFTLLSPASINTSSYGLTFPTDTTSNTGILGLFGPNLEAVTVVPEPSSTAIFVAAISFFFIFKTPARKLALPNAAIRE